jgi:hypothetical protein
MELTADWIAARSAPESRRAETVMSPLIPLKQSKYAIFIVVRSRNY